MNKKKLLIIEIVITLLLFISVIYSSNKEYQNYKKIVNEKVAMIVNNIHDKYPDVSEEEIIKIINDTNTNNDIITKYGYKNDDAYLNSMKNSYYASISINIIIVIIFVIIEIIIYYIYEKAQEKRIKEIDDYLKDINGKKYHLMIDDNNEDELSKLHNELYKTTVMLKETSEQNELEKKQIYDSLADISHQIKTPLTSIRILLDNISDNPNMDSKTREAFISDISKQIDWISYLVISLLKLARFDANAIVMNNEEISINKLINEIEDNLSVLLDIKNIHLVKHIDKNTKIKLDYMWNKEALTNIIKNAIEHSNENSNIDINVENTNLFLKIQIADKGVGISKEDKKHIFERFYKTNNSNKNSIGIGLALSKAIIEKENGYISVDSKKNHGTTFTIKYIK